MLLKIDKQLSTNQQYDRSENKVKHVLNKKKRYNKELVIHKRYSIKLLLVKFSKINKIFQRLRDIASFQ